MEKIFVVYVENVEETEVKKLFLPMETELLKQTILDAFGTEECNITYLKEDYGLGLSDRTIYDNSVYELNEFATVIANANLTPKILRTLADEDFNVEELIEIIRENKLLILETTEEMIHCYGKEKTLGILMTEKGLLPEEIPMDLILKGFIRLEEFIPEGVLVEGTDKTMYYVAILD